MPILDNFYQAHRHGVPPILGVGPDKRLFTSNPIYSKQIVPKITIKSLDKSTTYYTFNPFTSSGTTNKVIYASIGLSLSHHGIFEIQIEDSTKTLNTDLIGNAARVTISLGKTVNNLFTHLSGMIRETGYSRGCENNLLYNIKGSGTGIRLNERILDVLRDEPKTENDSTVVNTRDPEFAANRVVDDALDRASYYPKGIYPTEVEGTGGYGYIDSSGSTVDSPITDFIPGVVLRFGEISDLYNQIEDYTGARIYVDNNDRIQIRPIKTPATTNSGFRITTSINPDSDFADTTMYVEGDDYSFSDSISKEAGYVNSLFAILGATVVPDKDSSSVSNFYENKTVEIAQRFRPITNPHWRFFCGVEAVGMTNVNNENTVRTRWRICSDNNGSPQDVGGIVANKYMYPNKEYSTADGGLQVIKAMGEGSLDLDENRYYWLILSSLNSTATEYWRWYYDDTKKATTATAAPLTSSSTDGGSGWTLKNDRAMIFEQGRFKAEPHNVLDVLSVRKRILIESVVPTFPQQIKTKNGAIKYICGLIANTARPRRIFDFPSVTVPNKPIFPGDVCVIEDSRFGFSTAGNRIVSGQITDINYSFGIKGGGASPTSKGQSTMSLSVVGYPQLY